MLNHRSLLIFLECDRVFLLNMLVTLPRSRSNEPLLLALPLPLVRAICGGDIGSGSSAYGPDRMFCWSESSSWDLGGGRSDVFVGFRRRGVIVSADW